MEKKSEKKQQHHSQLAPLPPMSKIPVTTVTRDLDKLYGPTGNIYETVAIVARRANQISVEMKQELSNKLMDFASVADNLEEVFENREQIEVSRSYERLPKPSIVALEEFLHNRVYYRNPASGVELPKAS